MATDLQSRIARRAERFYFERLTVHLRAGMDPGHAHKLALSEMKERLAKVLERVAATPGGGDASD